MDIIWLKRVLTTGFCLANGSNLSCALSLCPKLHWEESV